MSARKQTFDEVHMKRLATTACLVCAKLGHTPLEHYESGEVLSDEDALRFARVVLDDDGLTNGRAQMLARYIVARLAPKPPKVQHYMNGVAGQEIKGCTCGFACSTSLEWSIHYREMCEASR